MNGLSQRKIDILKMAAHGMTVKESANELLISRSAVEKHLIDIRASFDARNIVNAVYKASKAGVIIYACVSMIDTGEMRRNAKLARVRQSAYVITQESCLG